MEKSCPGKEGYPASRVNFSERLYEKKVDPFANLVPRGRVPFGQHQGSKTSGLINVKIQQIEI